jgi:hypothetical protein
MKLNMGIFEFCSHHNPGTNMRVYGSIYIWIYMYIWMYIYMYIYIWIYIYGYQVPDTRSCQVPDRARYLIVPGTWSCQVPDLAPFGTWSCQTSPIWHRPINYWITVIWRTKIGICRSGTYLINSAPIWSILPLELLKMVEYEIEYGDFRVLFSP